jgi:hypothetical protein
MTIDYYKQLAPHAFGTITHAVFVTINGNEEYSGIQFTMTGDTPIRLMLNIAGRAFRETSEVFDEMHVDDILIDVYTQDSDENGSFSTNVLRTNLDELMHFLWGLGLGYNSHDLEFLSMDIDTKYPVNEENLVGINDGDFDPDEIDYEAGAKRSYLFDYGPTL